MSYVEKYSKNSGQARDYTRVNLNVTQRPAFHFSQIGKIGQDVMHTPLARQERPCKPYAWTSEGSLETGENFADLDSHDNTKLNYHAHEKGECVVKGAPHSGP